LASSFLAAVRRARLADRELRDNMRSVIEWVFVMIAQRTERRQAVALGHCLFLVITAAAGEVWDAE
jgi:hypothetical protein